ncbi:glycoside hydrolase [Nocardia sp. NPDC052566]|uniref:glycoside hydrolase n=1 Tax=Nocardia sp. NPDC052566 TaxID=3364330 RepID=UPI0037C7AC18
MRRIVWTSAVVTVVALSASGCHAGSAPATATVRVDGGTVEVPVDGGTAEISVADLAVRAGQVELSAAAGGLGAPGAVRVDKSGAHWSYPARGLDVTAAARNGRLTVDINGTRDEKLAWPVTGAGAADLQLPRGEGLNIPVADKFWNGADGGLLGEDGMRVQDLSMPFWGYSAGSTGASYLVPTDIGTTLTFASVDGRLRTTSTHEFRPDRGTQQYTVTFALTDGSPVAAAKDYRRLLEQEGKLTTLEQKFAANPQARKLIGAFHAYLWGDGRSPEAMKKLRELGLTNMWLGYDADEHPMTPEAVETAIDAGYLVGPYDTFDNAQNPAGEVDNPASRWPGTAWPDGCVHDENGRPETGFAGRGCYLSSQYLAEHREMMTSRVDANTRNGANSYFLDVDATGETFDDFSPDHPMTQFQDRQHRMDRMLAVAQHLVLGSESVSSWAAGAVTYSHGSSTPTANGLWKLEKDRQVWGTYAGANGPGVFFKPVELPAALHTAMFDPKYRVPLYETVLHDSVVSTDRWELPFNKLPAEQHSRALLAMLYNTPLNYTLNAQTIAEQGPRMAKLQAYFRTLQSAAGTAPMTDFRWLTPDHLVQRTTFGDGKLVVTANFGDKPAEGVQPGCVTASVGGTLCP